MYVCVYMYISIDIYKTSVKYIINCKGLKGKNI